jgi:hypothetical protein
MLSVEKAYESIDEALTFWTHHITQKFHFLPVQMWNVIWSYYIVSLDSTGYHYIALSLLSLVPIIVRTESHEDKFKLWYHILDSASFYLPIWYNERSVIAEFETLLKSFLNLRGVDVCKIEPWQKAITKYHTFIHKQYLGELPHSSHF